MTILVTGGAGYIGSHAVKTLKKSGHTVIIFDSLENGHEFVLDKLDCRDTFVQGDIRNISDLEKAFDAYPIDAVMHFAAYALVGESVHTPEKYLLNNTVGTINLLHTMAKHKVHKLIFSSTCAVYGEPNEVPLHEELPLDPVNPYGLSKLLSERAMREMANYSPMKITALRYFNACGADLEGDLGEGHPEETHLIPLVLQVAKGERESIKIFGTDYPTPDGTAIRDYIHVADLVDAHIKALEALETKTEPFTIYNLGTGIGCSVREIIETCRAVTGKDIPALEVARREGDPPELVANPKKANVELGWTPKHSNLETIITTAWNWEQQKSKITS